MFLRTPRSASRSLISRLTVALPVLALNAFLGGCATTQADGKPREKNIDPFEKFNRGVYRFNVTLDRYALKPAAVAYREYTPQLVQTGVGNFFENLGYPTPIANQFLQGKFKQGAQDTGRFLLNTTLGWERLLVRLDPILDGLGRLLATFAGRTPGAAELATHRAFRFRVGRGIGRLEPIAHVARFDLEDLVGVAPAIDALDANVRQLMAGLPFNDVLLFGSRGTGKSSAVRGLLTRYAAAGLRLVEVDRSDLAELPDLLATLHRLSRAASGRHAFLVFCDGSLLRDERARLPRAEGGPRGRYRGPSAARLRRRDEQSPSPAARGLRGAKETAAPFHPGLRLVGGVSLQAGSV